MPGQACWDSFASREPRRAAFPATLGVRRDICVRVAPETFYGLRGGLRGQLRPRSRSGSGPEQPGRPQRHPRFDLGGQPSVLADGPSGAMERSRIPDPPRGSLRGDLRVPRGCTGGLSPDGLSLGSFRPVEFLAGLGAGVTVRPGLRAGLSVHGLYLGSDGSRLTGMSVGGGLEWDVSGMTLGMAARNIGARPRGDQGVYRLPAEFTFSARSDVRRRATLGLVATRDRDGEMRGSLASRVRLHGGVSLMAGTRYETAADSEPVRGSAGLEVQLGALMIGYALTPGDELGSGHVVSVRFTRTRSQRPTAVLAAPSPDPVHRPSPASAELGVPAPATYAVWVGSTDLPRARPRRCAPCALRGSREPM